MTESLRIHPTIPGLAKLVQKDCTLPDGSNLRQGSFVSICPLFMGQCEANWPDAMKLDASRHIKKNAKGKESFEHPDMYKFTTFNAGKRVCIGKEFA